MMYINLQKNKVFTAITISAILIIASVLNNTYDDDIDCTGTFYIVPDNDSWSYLKGSISVTMMGNSNQGEVMFSGEARNKYSKLFRFERVLSFTYKNQHKNQYILSNVIVTKYAEDTLLDDVFSHYIYSSTSDKKDHLVILKMRNSYLMGNMIGPRHMCVSR